MDTSLPYYPSAQIVYSLNKELWRTRYQPDSIVIKSADSSADETEQKARLDQERLQQWRMRVKQIRGK
jgi:hypothetical protein